MGCCISANDTQDTTPNVACNSGRSYRNDSPQVLTPPRRAFDAGVSTPASGSIQGISSCSEQQHSSQPSSPERRELGSFTFGARQRLRRFSRDSSSCPEDLETRNETPPDTPPLPPLPLAAPPAAAYVMRMPPRNDTKVSGAEAELEEELSAAEFNHLRVSVALDDLQTDYEYLVVELKEARERLRRLEENCDDELSH